VPSCSTPDQTLPDAAGLVLRLIPGTLPQAEEQQIGGRVQFHLIFAPVTNTYPSALAAPWPPKPIYHTSLLLSLKIYGIIYSVEEDIDCEQMR
jgi:hypothetical protein